MKCNALILFLLNVFADVFTSSISEPTVLRIAPVRFSCLGIGVDDISEIILINIHLSNIFQNGF